jgi:hypothetical protein
VDGTLYRDDGAWFVLLSIAGLEVDRSGPFDDETDAELAKERALTIAGGP